MNVSSIQEDLILCQIKLIVTRYHKKCYCKITKYTDQIIRNILEKLKKYTNRLLQKLHGTSSSSQMNSMRKTWWFGWILWTVHKDLSRVTWITLRAWSEWPSMADQGLESSISRSTSSRWGRGVPTLAPPSVESSSRISSLASYSAYSE